MNKILGIDLGTTSIGWALVEKGVKLIDGGVVIFPRGNNQDQKNGKEESFSQQRTKYRGMRRRLFRRKLRRERLLSLIKTWWGLTPETIYEDTRPEELYRIRAEALDPNKNISLPELCRVFLYLAKKRGFKSNRKNKAKESSETGAVKSGIAELQQKLSENNFRTIGQYFYHLIKSHQNQKNLDERILGKWTSRQMYMDEFDLIVQTQKHKLPELSEDKIKLLRTEIFFQRPLKSAKHLVANCLFEPNKKVMPKSHPVFQEYRLWQILNNLIWVNKDTGETGNLTLEQKISLAELYQTTLKPKATTLTKAAGIPRGSEFNKIDLKACTTIIGLKNALGERDFARLGSDNINHIYHSLLYSLEDENSNDGEAPQRFKNFMHSKFDLSEKQSQSLWDIELEPDYGSISHKAAVKILPHLKKGMKYDEAAREAGYHHSVKNTYKGIDNIPPLLTNELRNPVVQKAVSQCIALVNKIIEVYGKPDEVVIELARELKKPKKKREEEWYRNKETEKRRNEYAMVLSRHRGRPVATWDSLISKYELWLELGCEDEDLRSFDGFAERIRPADKLKYDLWLEAGRISPYSGKVISLSQLFSPEIEIEHIVPYSRCLDNSRMNKTLCERNFNHDKTNKTPYEFFESRPKRDLDDFITRIGYMHNKNKRDQFLKNGDGADYLNSQLSDTAYIARNLVERINIAIKSVRVTKGRLTSLLSRTWGLMNIYENEGLSDTQKVDVKNRGDHRHHFVDAFVIANTDQSVIQRVARAELGNYGKLDGIEIDDPFPGYRGQVEEKANSLLVVHRMRKRLASTSKNKYRYSKIGSVQAIKSIRGSLHDETIYGKFIDEEGNEKFAVRKNVVDLSEDQLARIVDPAISNYLIELAKNTEGGWKNVIKSPIYYNGRPLRRVKWISKLLKAPMIREQTKSYINPGNNLVMAIYENSAGKRDYKTISYFDGTQALREGRPLFPFQIDDKRLLFTIKPYDKFVLCEHPDEVEWDDHEKIQQALYHVIKFTGTDIILGKTHLANIKADYDKKPVVIRCNYNTLKGVKVKLDITGRIVWKHIDMIEA